MTFPCETEASQGGSRPNSIMSPAYCLRRIRGSASLKYITLHLCVPESTRKSGHIRCWSINQILCFEDPEISGDTQIALPNELVIAANGRHKNCHSVFKTSLFRDTEPTTPCEQLGYVVLADKRSSDQAERNISGITSNTLRLAIYLTLQSISPVWSFHVGVDLPLDAN